VHKLSAPKDYQRMYYKLNNKIVGFKISFSELLYQITVMHNFSFFYFTWFADYRLRVNYSGSALNLSIPLARVFMQYYERFDGSAIELEKVKPLLTEQIMSISKTKTLLPLKIPTLKNCLLQGNHKLRESFLYRHLQNDLKHCHESNYLYESMISYDSTSSGTQMMGMLIRSKSVASLGLLVKGEEQKDVYESFLEYNRNICNEITKWFATYCKPRPKLKTFLEQTRIKIQALQELHYVELYNQKRWPDVIDKNYHKVYNEAFVSLCNDILSENPNITKQIEGLAKVITDNKYSKIFWLKSFSKLIFKKEREKIYSRQLKAFIILLEMYGYIHNFNSPAIQKVYIRALVKQMGMTSIYGATDFGRYQQLMEAYFSIIISKGINVTDSTFIQVSAFVKYLNPILIYWLEKEHPKLLELTKAIGAIKCKKDFQKLTLYSDTSTCLFVPKEYKTYRYSKNKKRFTYRLYLETPDYEKLSTALTANIIHFCDASLVHAYYRKLTLAKAIPIMGLRFMIDSLCMLRKAINYILYCKNYI
jgi:DNA-dependent RNA polymerase